MKIVSSAASDRGRVRRNNEDSFLADDALGLYVVADGMGGHAGGEVASRMAIEHLRDAVRTHHIPREDRQAGAEAAATEALGHGFQLANRSVLETGLRDTALYGMGTTMTALLAAGGLLHLAHIGDSRAYLLRLGRLLQLTEDHTLVGEQVRAGLLTPDQARTSVHRHILIRAVGIEPQVQTDLKTIGIENNDLFLLCSDGLTDMLSDEEIGLILAGTDVARIPQTLIESANRNGGKDNITAVVVKIGSRT